MKDYTTYSIPEGATFRIRLGLLLDADIVMSRTTLSRLDPCFMFHSRDEHVEAELLGYG
jgi:hypothetical protein